jgi:hypothetical protein
VPAAPRHMPGLVLHKQTDTDKKQIHRVANHGSNLTCVFRFAGGGGWQNANKINVAHFNFLLLQVNRNSASKQ